MHTEGVFMSSCLICDRIELIKQKKNPYFVKEMKSGYVVVGDGQFYKGYTLLLNKVHASELHQIDKQSQLEFLSDMAIVAEAVWNVFKPDKLNYELLGNTDEHMHWHIFPRRKTDPKPYTGVWAVDKSIRKDEKFNPTSEELKKMTKILSKEINKLLQQQK